MGSRPSPTEFVGRSDELNLLDDLLRSTVDGGSPIVAVLVSGDAGIGKTCLVDEFTSRARTAG